MYDASKQPSTTPKPIPSPKSTYETPEERAKRNLWNARSNALNAAIEYSSTHERADSDSVLYYASKFESWITRE